MPPPLEQEEHCMPPWGFAPSLDLAAASAEEPAQAGHHYSLSYNTCSPPADQPEGADFFDQLGPDPDSQVEEALDNVTSTPPRLSSEEAREQPEPAAPHTPHDSSSPPISPTLSLSLQPQYIPAAPQQSFFDQAEEERVELSFPSPAGDDDVDSSGGLFLPGQPQYPEDTLLAASPGLNGPSHVALGQGEQEEEEEGLALSAALGGWGHPAPAHTAPPVPLLPHLAAGAAGADADGGDGFISPRDADDEASRHLVSTADFIRQLLATISEGGSVHPATMLEARNLVSLIQDPRFITLVRGDAAESSPSTPGRSVYSTSLLMSVTPAKEAYAQHLMHGNPSPNTQATSSSSPADVGGDGTSSQQAMSFDTPSKPLRKSADGGVMAACTPFWPSPHPGQSADDYNFALDMSAQVRVCPACPTCVPPACLPACPVGLHASSSLSYVLPCPPPPAATLPLPGLEHYIEHTSTHLHSAHVPPPHPPTHQLPAPTPCSAFLADLVPAPGAAAGV